VGVKFKKINIMQKKRSISITQRKNSKKKTPSQNKKPCSICITKGGLGKLVQKSLFQKYSEGHISELRLIDKCI
jgi:hypothetical protein